MKNLKHIGALAIGGLCLLGPIGCTDLEEELVGGLPAGQFGQTESEFGAVVAGGYIDLFGLLGNHNGVWTANEVATDEVLVPTRGADWFDGGIFIRLHTHTFEPGDAPFANSWNKLFGGVATANRLLEQLPLLNAELAPPFEAELRGLRALYYYYLIDMFGNVPLITSFSGGEENPSTLSRAELYDWLTGELEEIIPTLPEEKRYARITRDVARTLLAKVYLNSEVYAGRNEVAQALPHLNAVIDGGRYRLESDYFANFSFDNEGSAENILVIPYDDVFVVPNNNFNLAHMTLHYASRESFNATAEPWNGYATLQEFYDSYDDTDSRKGEFGSREPGNFLAGPQTTADGEPLIDASAESTDPDGNQIVFTPELNELGPNALRQAGARIYKWTYANGFTPELSNDWAIFRYADVLLMKAEALMRTTSEDNAEALELVNLIRDRAYDDTDEDGNEVDSDLDQLTFETLLAERGREMFAECYRRSDLIRFGEFQRTWFGKDQESGEQYELFPIPTAQLDVNPNLRQNPGF